MPQTVKIEVSQSSCQLHCVDHIYRDTPSARIARLYTAASREKEPPSHSHLHTAVLWGIKCLSDTYLETAV